MFKFAATLFLLVGLVTSVSFAQTVSPDKSLGDFAREQKAQKALQKSNGGKVLNLVGTSDASAAGSDAGPSSNKQGADEAKSQLESAQKSKTSDVFDNSLSDKTEPWIVPAGTQIRVDLVDGKVIVPVRVGFATPIPALSKVAVQVDRTYYPTGLVNISDRVGYVGYADYATLTAVTVGGVTYPVASSAIPVATPGSGAVTLDNTMGSSPRDATFVLSEPVAIER